MRAMNERQYKDLFDAIVDLRATTEMGFNRVDRRFNEYEERWGRRFSAMEGRFDTLEGRFDRLEGRFDVLEGRFDVLEGRFEGGFRELSASIANLSSRLSAVEQH